jgi:MFS family permease
VRRGSERTTGDFAGPAFDRRLIAPLILGAVLNPINSSMIAVALVPIGISFGAPPSQTAWLVSGLYLATAVGQPVVGRLVDMYGPRRLYLLGTALTGVAGVLGVLVLARVVLGFGTCAGYPAAMYLIRSESRRTGRDSPNGILTALAVSSQTVAVIGPTLGGLLIDLGGWRTIFAVNIPLSAAGLLLGALRMPNAAVPRTGTSVDLPGITLFAGALTAALLYLMNPRPAHLWLLAVAAAVAAVLTRRELRAPDPFLDVRLLAGNLPLLATYARNVLTFTVSYAYLYGYTQWLEQGRGLTPSVTGLVLLPMFLVAIVVATATGRRREVRGKLLIGGVAQLAGTALLLIADAHTAIWLLIAVAVIVGVPQGLNSLANQNALYYQADPSRIASSAGLLRTCTYLGALIASAANGAFLSQGATTPGLHHLALFVLAAATLLLAFAVLDPSLSRIGAPQPAPD